MENGLMNTSNIPAIIKEKMIILGFTPEKFESEASNAIQIWNNPKNSYLRSATPESFYSSLVNLCKINLTLNPIAKEAYLVPRKNGNNVEVCLEPSYIGLVKLLTEAGTVSNIQTNLVYQNDTFDQFYDMNGINFKHIPAKKERGQIVGVYCLAFLPSGNKQFEYMAIDEINDIKKVSESYKAYEAGKTKSTVWKDYEGEMIRKTCLRRIYKYLPHGTKETAVRNIQEAIQLDESAFSASNEQIQYIESLLMTSGLPEERKEEIEREFVTMTSAGACRCIEYLKNNQIAVMDAGNPSQTEIKNHLNKIS
jgi:phage RecT family recombinase